MVETKDRELPTNVSNACKKANQDFLEIARKVTSDLTELELKNEDEKFCILSYIFKLAYNFELLPYELLEEICHEAFYYYPTEYLKAIRKEIREPIDQYIQLRKSKKPDLEKWIKNTESKKTKMTNVYYKQGKID